MPSICTTAKNERADPGPRLFIRVNAEHFGAATLSEEIVLGANDVPKENKNSSEGGDRLPRVDSGEVPHTRVGRETQPGRRKMFRSREHLSKKAVSGLLTSQKKDGV